MEPLDLNALRQNCAADEALMREVLELFVKESAMLLGDVRAAVASGVGLRIKSTSHRLKGALVSLGAPASAEAARALEAAGVQGELAAAPALLERLEGEITRLLDVIATTPV